MSELRETPLTPWHAENGGRMVDFAGYSMPVQYEGLMAEHRRVRETVGVFDVSHMGELYLRGTAARDCIDRLVTNNVGKLATGAVLYTAMCRENGTVIDDLLVYCMDEQEFLVVCNASNRERVVAWIQARLLEGVEFQDATDDTALFALQGPASADVLRKWSEAAAVLDSLDYYHVARVSFEGHSVLLSRTGYTGELGYELYAPADQAVALWKSLLEWGKEFSIAPAGLGARDTLRLEAGYALYGHELDDDTTPYEGGIGWVVKSKKASPFVGKDALVAQKQGGVPRQLVALRLPDRAIARAHAPVFHGEHAVGEVTSGTFSPTLEAPIALAKVAASAVESILTIEIRGRRVEAETVSLPFVPSRVKVS